MTRIGDHRSPRIPAAATPPPAAPAPKNAAVLPRAADALGAAVASPPSEGCLLLGEEVAAPAALLGSIAIGQERAPVVPLAKAPRALTHAFDMRWKDIAELIPAWKAAGYDAVQIPPIFPHLDRGETGRDAKRPWWEVYQPVSFASIGDTAQGTRAELRQLVDVARRNGVRLIADMVVNHHASQPQGVGTNGEPYAEYGYPDGMGYEDFHHCAGEPKDIQSYQDRHQVQSHELVGLDDIATEKPGPRLRIASGFVLAMVEGLHDFRIDAAKHMPGEDLHAVVALAAEMAEALATKGPEALDLLPGVLAVPEPARAQILAPLKQLARERPLDALREQVASGRPMWLFQEVIDMGGEPVSAKEYLPYPVTEFKAGHLIAKAFKEGRISDLAGLGGLTVDAQGLPAGPLKDHELLPSDQAVVGLCNHDNERGHGGGSEVLTWRDAQFDLANVFMLAYPYGVPALISSYDFVRPDGSFDTDMGRPDDRGRWCREDLRPAIRNMLGFRAATEGTPASEWRSGTSKQIAFCRGDKGFLALNDEGTAMRARFQTRLPPGEYFNAASDYQATGQTFRVEEDGSVELEVPAHGAVALCVGLEA